ncbi:hypothetical protein DFH09DRAFT_1129412 [Mycena vulgaris]|nr:hypothetical protein DFH09DRAFT_1129412 [Mycena vulgaris]
MCSWSSSSSSSASNPKSTRGSGGNVGGDREACRELRDVGRGITGGEDDRRTLICLSKALKRSTERCTCSACEVRPSSCSTGWEKSMSMSAISTSSLSRSSGVGILGGGSGMALPPPNCNSAEAMLRPRATLLPRPLPNPRSKSKWRRAAACEEFEGELELGSESKELSVEEDASLERSSGSERLLALRALLRLFSSPELAVLDDSPEAVVLVPSVSSRERGSVDAGLSRSKPNCSKERLNDVVLGGRER